MAVPVLGILYGTLDGRGFFEFNGVRAKSHLGFLVSALWRSCAGCKIGRLGGRRHESLDVMIEEYLRYLVQRLTFTSSSWWHM